MALRGATLNLSAAACLAFVPAYGSEGGWKLAWSDEFAGPAVDAASWGFESGYVRNQELQYYGNRPENSRIEDGTLLIQALHDGWNGHAYTSASRTTRGKRSWKYGRFELRARIDPRAGSWPAWWWLPDSGGWPKGGEIDMLESYQGKCLFNVMDGEGKWTSPTKTVASLGGASWTANYHTWTMEWDSTRIDLLLDGALMNHYPVADADGTGPGGGNPFRHAGYLILNQAIGGTAGGDPSATVFPVEFRIDWIRVHAWTPGPSHLLTVTGGAGSGTYLTGAPVSLTAGPPPAGRIFDRWVVTSGVAEISDPAAEDARLPMPAGDAAITATFKPGTALRMPTPSRWGVGRGPAMAAAGPGHPPALIVYSLAGRAVPFRALSFPAAGLFFAP
jgi:beta-glucanase (GH16 family)